MVILLEQPPLLEPLPDHSMVVLAYPLKLSDADAVALYAVWDVSDGVSLAGRYDTLDDGSDTTSMWSATLGYSVWENVLTRLEYNYETGDREHGDSNAIAVNLFYQF